MTKTKTKASKLLAQNSWLKAVGLILLSLTLM